MPSIPRIILSDFLGLCRVCGVRTGVRWLACIARRLRECRRTGSLQPADAAMGQGPFLARRRAARARLTGEQAISGIREIWVRDVYLGGGFLSIAPDAVVVDLGCNMGNFTLLALGHGPQVRVVCVEADRACIPKVERSLATNGWAGRARIINAFVGGTTGYQSDLEAAEGGRGVPHLSSEAFLAQAGLAEGRVDFLKCDIEGSEFELLASGSPLLGMTDQLAVEVHKNVGRTDAMRNVLRAAGFEVKIARTSPPADILLARRAIPQTPRPPATPGGARSGS
jgi:FkbM family methyltransferase